MNFRQIQAILHSWFGIIILWLLFFIFFTGSIAYFRTEINMWAQPEVLHQVGQPPSAHHSAQTAYDYLSQHAPDAQRWRVSLANDRMPVNVLQWQSQDGRQQHLQDPNTGALLAPVRESLGGDFFFKLHYTLYPLPAKIGSTVVAIAALILLISLITGIITHRKIIKEFFVFRSFKGQRSLLDLHHITGVVSLPFYLIMAFTGLLILFYLVLPWGVSQQYGKAGVPQLYQELQFSSFEKPALTETTAMPPFAQFAQQLPEQADTGAVLNKFDLQKSDQSDAIIRFEYQFNQIITLNTPYYSFVANTALPVNQSRNLSPIAQLASSSYGIHLGYFAAMWTRFLLAMMGVIGCVMLAAGALLWQKKRIKQQTSLSYRLVHHLNIFTFLGLPLACASYFLIGRLLPPAMEFRGSYEVWLFYLVWFMSFGMSWILSTRVAILCLLVITSLVLFLVPLSSWIWVPELAFGQRASHVDGLFFVFDLVFALLAIGYAWASYMYLKKFNRVGVTR